MNWKGEVLSLLIHWLLPGVATVLLLAGLRRRWPRQLPPEVWTRWAIPVFLLTRVAYIPILYSLPGFQGGGDFLWWVSHSRPILDGKVPGRDFQNNYGPLFPYLQAAGIWLTGGWSVGVLLPYVIADAVVVFLGARLAAIVLGPDGGRWAGAWLLLSPLQWHQVVVRAADEPVFLASLLGAVWLVLQAKPLRGMAVLALGLCATKVLYAPYAAAVGIVVWRDEPRRAMAAAVFVGTCLLVCGLYALLGGDVLQFARYRGEELWWLNVSSVAFAVAPAVARWPALAAYVLVSLAAAAWAALAGPGRNRAERFVYSLALVQSVSLLFQPFVTVNHICQGLAFVLMPLAFDRDRPLEEALAWLLPLLGFFVSVCSDTNALLYKLSAAPLFLAVNAGFVVLVLRQARGRPGPPEDREPVAP
jgi:hypothetical protein